MAKRPTPKPSATRRPSKFSAAGWRASGAKSKAASGPVDSGRVGKGTKASGPAKAGDKKSAPVVPGLDLMRNLNFSLYHLTVFGILVFGVFSLEPHVRTWVEQQQQIAALQAEVNQAKKAVADMEEERVRWDDPVYVRSQARDRLYYVMPGEVSYLVMDADGVDTSDTTGTVGAQMADARNTTEITDQIRETKDNWVDSLLYTVVHAGLDEPKQESK